VKHQSELFKRSIHENNPVWGFVITAMLKTLPQMPLVILIERIVRPVRFKFGFVVRNFLCGGGRLISNELSNYLAHPFPHEVIAAIAGHVDHLNVRPRGQIRWGARLRDHALALITVDDSQEAKLVRVMLRHLNPTTNQFVFN
jgi:hypothetical protein